MTGLGFGESRTIRRETAAEVVEEQAREYADRDGVPEDVAEHVAILAGVIADSIRSHVPEHEDTAPCPECGNLSLLILGRRRRRVLLAIDRERKRQEVKWGDQRHTPFAWMVILTEEVGEAAKAALHDKFGGGTPDAFREELVQVAAVAVQVLEVIDAGELHAPPRGGVENPCRLVTDGTDCYQEFGHDGLCDYKKDKVIKVAIAPGISRIVTARHGKMHAAAEELRAIADELEGGKL